MRFFWEIFENCQLKTRKILKSLRFFESFFVTIYGSRLYTVWLTKTTVENFTFLYYLPFIHTYITNLNILAYFEIEFFLPCGRFKFAIFLEDIFQPFLVFFILFWEKKQFSKQKLNNVFSELRAILTYIRPIMGIRLILTYIRPIVRIFHIIYIYIRPIYKTQIRHTYSVR